MAQVPGAPYEPFPSVAPAERILRPGGVPMVPDAYGAATARAVSTFGGDVATAGKEVFDAAIKYRQMQNEMGTRDEVNDWYNNTAAPAQDDYLSKRGVGASSDVMHQHVTDLDAGRVAARARVIQKYGPAAGVQFDSDTASIMRSLGREAVYHSMRETDKAQTETYKNSADVSKNLVYNASADEKIYNDQKTAALKQEDDYGRDRSTPDVIEQNKKDRVNTLALARVTGAAERDGGTGVAYDLFKRLRDSGDLSNEADIQAAEKVVRQRFFEGSTAAIESREQRLLDEVRATGLTDSPRAKQIQSEIVGYRQRRVDLGEPVDTSTRANDVLQQKVNAAAFEYSVNRELRGSSPFQGMIDTAAARHGQNPIIFARQLNQESGLNPNVRDSSAGAKGIAQFIDSTAAQYGVNVRDPASSIEGAAHYMEDLTRQFGGNTGLALAAYNAGPDRVNAWLQGRAVLPAETRDYVKKITGLSANDWRAGETPDMTTLKAPPGAAGSVQRAAQLVDQARTDPGVPPSQRDLNATAGENVIKKYVEDNVRLANQTAVERQQINDKFLSDVIKDSTREQPQYTETIIKNLPDETQGGPSASAKQSAIRFLRTDGLPGPSDADSHRNVLGLFRRINLPEGDADKITDRKVLMDAVGTTINRQDYDWVEKKFDDLRSPTGERIAKLRGEFSKMATKYLDTSSLLKIDQEGALRNYNFERFVDSVVGQWQAAGKGNEIYQLFTPGPHYLGDKSVLDNFDASADEQIANVNRRLNQNIIRPPTTPGPPQPPTTGIGAPRKANENMNDYDRRVLGISD